MLTNEVIAARLALAGAPGLKLTDHGPVLETDSQDTLFSLLSAAALVHPCKGGYLLREPEDQAECEALYPAFQLLFFYTSQRFYAAPTWSRLKRMDCPVGGEFMLAAVSVSDVPVHVVTQRLIDHV